MKKLLFLSVVIFTISISSTKAQSITDEITISGDIRTGANYLPLLGIHASKNMMIYTELMAVHKSGFGVGYFAYDDFSKELSGRTRFVDALYMKTWDKFSLYSAFEYVWYDNNKDGECWMPYLIGTYSGGSWSFQAAPMLTFFPHNDKNKSEFTMYGKVTKTVFKDIDIHATIWYDNVYNDNTHFYGAVGATINLPKNFYVMSNMIYKSKKAEFFINVGWKFTTKN